MTNKEAIEMIRRGQAIELISHAKRIVFEPTIKIFFEDGFVNLATNANIIVFDKLDHLTNKDGKEFEERILKLRKMFSRNF